MSMTIPSFKALAVAACAVSSSAFAQPAPDQFRIAVVAPAGGNYGLLSQGVRRGVEMAVEERSGKVLGKPIAITLEDDDNKPQVAIQKANAAAIGGAQLFVGSLSSPVTLALMKVAQSKSIPLISIAAGDDRITGSDRNRYTFRTSNSFGMEVKMTSAYVESAALKSVFAVLPDVGATRDAWAAMQVELKAMKVEVAGEAIVPLGASDYSIAIDRIMKSSADGVVNFMAGGDSIAFTRQALAVGMRKKAVLFGPAAYEETNAAALGANAVGLQSGVRYNNQVNNPRNKGFVERYRKKFGEEPPVFAGTAYDGVSWFLDVVEASKTWDREKWVQAFEISARPDSVVAPQTMRACDHQAAHDGLWAEIVSDPSDAATPRMNVVRTVPAARLFGACPK